MTTAPATSSPSSPSTGASTGAGAASGAARGRVALLAAGLAAGALTTAALLVWQPWGERNASEYAQLAPLREGVWAGSLADGLGYALALVCLAGLTCALAVGRGRSLATVGAALAVVGGLLFAMGAAARGVLLWFLTTDAVPEAVGAAALAQVEEEPLRLVAVVGAGFVTSALGTLLLAVGLLRSRAVPRWLPVGVLVLVAAQFTPVPTAVLDAVQVALMATFVALAVVAVRHLRGR